MYCWIISEIFTMVERTKKNKEEPCTVPLHAFGKAHQEWIDSNFAPKKPIFVPGFEPGLLGQNAVALPLAPTPPPPRTLFFEFCIYFGSGAPPVGTSSFAKRLGHQRNGSFKVFR